MNSNQAEIKNIILDREYVYDDVKKIFYILANNDCFLHTYCLFGPLLNNFQIENQMESQSETGPNIIYLETNLECTTELFHYIHYFYILNFGDDFNQSQIVDVLAENNIKLTIEYSKTLQKREGDTLMVDLVLKKFKLSWDFSGGGEWFGYIFNYKRPTWQYDTYNQKLSESEIMNFFTDIFIRFYKNYDVFKISKYAFYKNKFISVFDLCSEFDVKFDFSIKYSIISVPIEIFHEKEYKKNVITKNILRKIYYFLYRMLYKKFIAGVALDKMNDEFTESKNCFICFDDKVFGLCSIKLHCCHQEICLDCLTKLFLTCHKVEYFEKKTVYLPCPFCRHKIFCDSTFDC